MIPIVPYIASTISTVFIKLIKVSQIKLATIINAPKAATKRNFTPDVSHEEPIAR